jgi:hypothetical protein
VRPRWMVLLFAALALGACSSDDDSDADDGADERGEQAEDGGAPDGDDGSGGDDPCTLLRDREVENLTGLEVVEARSMQPATAQSACSWTLQGENTGLLTVIVYEPAVARSIFDTLPDDREEVDGVGDEGSWIPGVRSLYVVDGQRLVMVQLATEPSLDDEIDRTSRLARRALRRL